MNQPTRENIEEILLGMERPQEFYKQAMERIEGQPDDIRSLAKRTLTWITRAKRPLSITEIQHALAVRERMTEFDPRDMPDVKALESACAGLVFADEKCSSKRLVYHSTRKFFQQSQEKWFLEGESYITKICLTYLSFSTFDGALCQTNKELKDRLESYPFYSYAVHNWGHHARESFITSQQIMNFLESTVKVEASSQVLTSNGHGDLLYGSFDSQKIYPTKMTGLHLAAYFGLERAVDNLLQFCNNKDKYGRTPLSWAAENGHVPVVEQLIATRQVEVDSKDKSGKTPLIWAAKEGHTAVVQLLLDNGAHPNLQSDSYRTSLLYAAESGHTEIVQLLLDRGAVTEVWNERQRSYEKSPLSYAAENGDIEIVQLLLDRGAKTEFWDARQQCYEKSPLSYAAQQGHIAIIELLLEAGAGISSEFKEDDGWRPLMWAVRGRQKAAVELLLDRGADVDAEARGGNSPLSVANDLRYDDIAQLLLDRGAQP